MARYGGGITFRIDATAFRKDLTKKLNEKAKGITTDNDLYTDISEILVDIIRSYMNYYDTGASRDQEAGRSDKTGHDREGYLGISRAHGIEWDAIDINPHTGTVRHYIEPLIGKALNTHERITPESVMSALKERGDWEDFLNACKPLIVRAMQKEK